MRNLVALAMIGGLFGGCIIYEEELVPGDDGRELPDRDGDGVIDDDDGYVDYELWLEPAGAALGDVAIVSLKGTGDVDLSQVEGIRFFGNSAIEVIATDTRNSSEFLLTVSVPAESAVGANDLLVEFGDGTAVFVEAAFEVVTDPSQVPDDGSGDGSGGDGTTCP